MSFRKEALCLMVTENLSVCCFPGLRVKRWWSWHNLFLLHLRRKEKAVVPVFHWHSPYMYTEERALCLAPRNLCCVHCERFSEALAPFYSILSADASGIRAEIEPSFSSTPVPWTGHTRESEKLLASVGWALGRLCYLLPLLTVPLDFISSHCEVACLE